MKSCANFCVISFTRIDIEVSKVVVSSCNNEKLSQPKTRVAAFTIKIAGC